MPHIFKDFFIISFIVAIAMGFFIFGPSYYQHPSQISSVLQVGETPLLPEGTLIKTQGDERVYYIENGKKRWIESKESFRLQGFRSEDIHTFSASETGHYPEGEPVTGQSYVVLPQELNTLPDLAPLPIKDLRLKNFNGRTTLKFTASFWNQGKRHFELATDPQTEIRNGETYQAVRQPIAREDGSYRNKVVGSFAWHAPHKHYHYSDFADYVFSFVKPATGVQVSNPPKTVRQKTTFCIRDNEPLSLALPGAPKKAVFPTCGQSRQGISIGWVDVYKNTLPDQYIDIHDMPAGLYSLSFFLDPNQRFAEERKDNNISTIFIDLDVKKKTVKIVASAAPFATALNSFANETLIRAGGEGKVYVTHNNKKRPLNNSEVFNSYNYSWEDVLVLTQNMIDAIPSTKLIRFKGTEEVYVLNDLGYKRHIPNPEVFQSYGFTAEDIADINRAEFSSYPISDLVRRAGNGEIYLISGSSPLRQGSSVASKRKIGTLDIAQSLGYDLDAVHTLNETDFNAYVAIP